MSRAHFVGGVKVADESVSFDPALHFPALALVASRLPDLRMMIVDPIVSAVAGDSHKNAEVRRGLAPLVAFAEQSGAPLSVSRTSRRVHRAASRSNALQVR